MSAGKHKNVSLWPSTYSRLKQICKSRRLVTLTNALDVIVEESFSSCTLPSSAASTEPPPSPAKALAKARAGDLQPASA